MRNAESVLVRMCNTKPIDHGVRTAQMLAPGLLVIPRYTWTLPLTPVPVPAQQHEANCQVHVSRHQIVLSFYALLCYKNISVVEGVITSRGLRGHMEASGQESLDSGSTAGSRGRRLFSVWLFEGCSSWVVQMFLLVKSEHCSTRGHLFILLVVCCFLFCWHCNYVSFFGVCTNLRGVPARSGGQRYETCG